jgi:hypothetical protein
MKKGGLFITRAQPRGEMKALQAREDWRIAARRPRPRSHARGGCPSPRLGCVGAMPRPCQGGRLLGICGETGLCRDLTTCSYPQEGQETRAIREVPMLSTSPKLVLLAKSFSRRPTP